ncbi:MAG: DUF354 domain-containing protein [Desulfohalobiaceae bacterium]|nr:DUF354 domain-containing protein [Desulfohalobiaceae bacterium]
MKILIDITHPAHLHFFRNAVSLLKMQGHEVKLTGRDKDILGELAEQYGLKIEKIGKFKPGMVNLTLELIYRWWHLIWIVLKWKPDIIMACAGPYVGLAGWLTQTPTHIFYNNEFASLSNIIAYPFATCIHVPECYNKPIRWPHRRYAGYHELAYLHPQYFTPDPSVLNDLGVKPDEKFVLLRFVGWGAAHDVGHKGIALAMKRKAVQEFSKQARVFITSETQLPSDLEKYRFPLASSRIHDAMAFATLLYGESATMASEAAILGTPAIYLDDVGRGYTNEQEQKYGLVFNFSESVEDQKLSIEKGIEILKSDDMKEAYGKKNGNLLQNTIDVTHYLTNITEF